MVELLKDLMKIDPAGVQDYEHILNLHQDGIIDNQSVQLVTDEYGFYFYRMASKPFFKSLLGYADIHFDLERDLATLNRVRKVVSSDLTHRYIDVERGYKHGSKFLDDPIEFLYILNSTTNLDEMHDLFINLYGSFDLFAIKNLTKVC